MLLLGVDVESTGLKTDTDLIIEIGAVIWDTDLNAPVYLMNRLVNHEVPIPDEITKITGITGDMIHDFGIPPLQAFTELHDLIKSANWIVAHNGRLFDMPMLRAQMARLGVAMVEKPLIDTSTDLPFPDGLQTRKLTYLAAEHGFLNPFAHRALFDVLTMLKIVEKYPLGIVCKLASEPTVTIKALVSYDDREKAKQRGYRWDGDKKQWIKSLKQSQVEKESTEASFKVIQLD